MKINELENPFTEDQIDMLWAAMVCYMEKGFSFKGGTYEEHKVWQALGKETWEKISQIRKEVNHE